MFLARVKESATALTIQSTDGRYLRGGIWSNIMSFYNATFKKENSLIKSQAKLILLN